MDCNTLAWTLPAPQVLCLAGKWERLGGAMNFSQPMLHVKTDHTRHNQHVGLISMRFITIQHFGFLAPPMKHCSMIYNEFWVLTPKEWIFSCQDGLGEGNTVPCFQLFSCFRMASPWLVPPSFWKCWRTGAAGGRDWSWDTGCCSIPLAKWKTGIGWRKTTWFYFWKRGIPTPTSLLQSCTRICSHPPWGWPFVQGVAFRERHLQLCELESQKIIDAKVSKGRSSVGNDALVISALWHRPSVSPGSE